MQKSVHCPFIFVPVLVLVMLLTPAATRADAVLDWNKIAVDTAVANGANPFAQGRFAAIVQLAVFEAVNSVTQEYHPYIGITPRPGASAEAAAIEAAYEVLSEYFGANSQSVLDPAYSTSLASVPSGEAKTEGMMAGHEAAQAMIALRMGDGSTPLLVKIPGPPVPGDWQATVTCPKNAGGVQVGTGFNWQFVTPFGIHSAADFLLPPPPALTSERYARAYNEVMTVGSDTSAERPQDRADVVHFFAADSPTQAMNQAAREVAQEQNGTLSENARALALVNMAINDALVASFYNKYHYNFWRPETAIHGGDLDGNPRTAADPTWAPFIKTPCFPSYPSNHGSGGNAAAEVLRHLYGEAGHSITLTNSTIPTITLQYTSFKQITDDISDARVYGGIHFRTDQDAGAVLGRAVGAAVYKNNLRPHDE